jgi:hypothetical protein
MWILPLGLNCYAFDISTDKLTIYLEDSSIKSLTKKIFDQTGYTLIFPENFYSMKLSGNYSNVTINTLLSSLLKGISYSFVIKEEEAVVIVHLFNSSSFADSPIGTDVADEQRSSLPEVYNNEFNIIAMKNNSEFQAFRNNPLSIDPASGLQFKELLKKTDTAEAIIEKIANRDSNVDPFSGEQMSNTRIISLGKSVKAHDAISKPIAIDSTTGENIQKL